MSAAYAPSQPAELPEAYRLAVADYLEREALGYPTGLAWLRLQHPDPPCHTGGAGPLSACPACGP